MELRPPTARERQKIIDECEWLERMIADLSDYHLRPAEPVPDTLVEAAVAEGATLVRIGTALFGPRT